MEITGKAIGIHSNSRGGKRDNVADRVNVKLLGQSSKLFPEDEKR